MDDDEKDTFAETMDGLNQAVEWVRTHLLEFQYLFSINTGSGLGVEISFGVCYGECGQRVKAIERLFAGKCVSRTYDSSGYMTYRFSDEVANIKFRWHVSVPARRSSTSVELVQL